MRSWWSTIDRQRAVFDRLSKPADLPLLLRIFLFAAAVPVLLRLKLSRLQALLEPAGTLPPPDPARIQKVQALIEAVLQARLPLVRPGCLTRGVTLYYFLRRAGLDVQLFFGAGFVGEEFAGHCWLVRDGEPYLETRDPRPMFTVMYTIPAEASLSRV